MWWGVVGDGRSDVDCSHDGYLCRGGGAPNRCTLFAHNALRLGDRASRAFRRRARFGVRVVGRDAVSTYSCRAPPASVVLLSGLRNRKRRTVARR